MRRCAPALFALLTPSLALAAEAATPSPPLMQELASWLSSYPLLAPLLFVLLYGCAVVLFMPGALFCMLGGALFGTWLGALLSIAGASAGAAAAFLIARYLAAGLVENHLGNTLQRLKRGVEREGWRFVALVRLIPVVPYDLSNYAFGLSRIPLAQFTAANAICLAPRICVYAYIGHSGIELLGKEGDRLLNLVSMATLLIAVVLLPYLYGRIRRPFNHSS